jgi:hypothetical protein
LHATPPLFLLISLVEGINGPHALYRRSKQRCALLSWGLISNSTHEMELVRQKEGTRNMKTVKNLDANAL